MKRGLPAARCNYDDDNNNNNNNNNNVNAFLTCITRSALVCARPTIAPLIYSLYFLRGSSPCCLASFRCIPLAAELFDTRNTRALPKRGVRDVEIKRKKGGFDSSASGEGRRVFILIRIR